MQEIFNTFDSFSHPFYLIVNRKLPPFDQIVSKVARENAKCGSNKFYRYLLLSQQHLRILSIYFIMKYISNIAKTQIYHLCQPRVTIRSSPLHPWQIKSEFCNSCISPSSGFMKFSPFALHHYQPMRTVVLLPVRSEKILIEQIP